MTILNVQDLNTVFEPFLCLKDHTVWVRSTDYREQIYISPHFETIWERPCEEMYNSPLSWNESLLINCKTESWRKQLQKRIPKSPSPTLAYYIIQGHRTQKVKYIRDRVYYLYNSEINKFVGVAGISQEISEQAWDAAFKNKLNEEKEVLKDFEQRIQDLKLQPRGTIEAEAKDTDADLMVDQVTLTLSRRQLECLYHMLLGYTVKETARVLKISPRTVETHIDVLKKKFNCQRKIEFSQKVKLNDVLIKLDNLN